MVSTGRSGSLIGKILQQGRLGWQDARAVNQLLLCGFPSQQLLRRLEDLLQAIDSRQICLEPGRHQQDLTTSIRLWQLYLLNHSKVGAAPKLSGLTAACPLS
ncbi:MAG: hypothetical protein Q6K99_11565 [Thermostichales cyanobacterium BF4_bins_65]